MFQGLYQYASLVETEKGISITEKTIPLKSAGAYVPGGRASYPSTVLMTCIPARVAGVQRIVVTSPPPVSDAVIVSADICGVDEIYRAGGAQAIAALAYGTESIQRVDKIVGPGNMYVMAAKMLVYGTVDIDMPAGPSEILIIADETSQTELIAADVLAQAEHDPDARCVIVTDSKKIVDKIERDINIQKKGLERKEIIAESLKNLAIILTGDISESTEFANMYVPEHLEIMTKNPEDVVGMIWNAGTVFVGDYSPVSAGDYASGGNHVLPTGGTARFASGLGVRDFLRTFTVQRIEKTGLKRVSKTIIEIANSEGLDAHSRSVGIRLGQ